MSAKQNWPGPMRWPLDRTEDGQIVIIQLELDGPITKFGFSQLRKFIDLWEEAWFPEPEEIEPPQPVKGES